MFDTLVALQRKKLIQLAKLLEIPKNSLKLLPNRLIAEVILRRCGKLLRVANFLEDNTNDLEKNMLLALSRQLKIAIPSETKAADMEELIFRKILERRLNGLSRRKQAKLNKNLEALENEWERLGLLNNISATAALTAVGVANINVATATLHSLSILSSTLGMTVSWGAFAGALSITSTVLGPIGWSAVGLLWVGTLIRQLLGRSKRMVLEVLIRCYQARLKLNLGHKIVQDIDQVQLSEYEDHQKATDLKSIQETSVSQLKQQFREETVNEVLESFINDIEKRDREIRDMTFLIQALQKEKEQIEYSLSHLKEEQQITSQLLELTDSQRSQKEKLVYPDHEPKIDRQFEHFLISLASLPKVDRVIWSRNLQTKSYTQIKEVRHDGEVKIYYTDRHQYAAKLRVFPVTCRDLTQAYYFAEYIARSLNLPRAYKITQQS